MLLAVTQHEPFSSLIQSTFILTWWTLTSVRLKTKTFFLKTDENLFFKKSFQQMLNDLMKYLLRKKGIGNNEDPVYFQLVFVLRKMYYPHKINQFTLKLDASGNHFQYTCISTNKL